MTHPTPKPGILDISPYIGGEGRGDSFENPLRLASNENQLGPSPLAREAYLKCASDLHRYPDGAATDLRQALAREYNIDPERIVCGGGSDELISLIAQSYAGVGDDIVYSQYGFLRYPICARAVGARPVPAPEKDMRTDIEALIKAVTPQTKIVFLANPNNPTGSYISADDMRSLRERLPSNVLLVIDAAYAEFVQEKDYDDGRALAATHENVVMLRTFSKIYGLAALRLGWGYFPKDVAGVINRVRSAFNASAPAQAAGVAALADKDFVRRSVEMATAGRRQLSEGFSSMGLKAWPSVANFLLVEFGAKTEDIRLALKSQGIYVRQMDAYGLPQCLRVTVGTEDDNRRLLAGVKKAL